MTSHNQTSLLTNSVRDLTPSATLAINERSAALQAEGRQVFKLGLGQSPFPVPSPVVESLREHAGQKDYLAVQGLPELREAIAAWHRRRDNVDAAATRVLVGPGSKELMFLIQLVHNSVLTIPRPSWVSYAPQAGILKKPVEWIETRQEDGWRLSPTALDAACRTTPHTRRLLILNYPNNPTGLTYDQRQLVELAEVAREHGVVVLSDEIYGEVNHDGTHHSIATYYPEGTIISSGLSKWCGAGGWRLGYFVFPEQLRPLLSAVSAVASETFTSVSAPIQWASIRAFQPCAEIERYLADSRRVLKALGGHITQSLRDVGAVVPTPEGGFYIMPDFSPLAGALMDRGIGDSAALTEQILQDTGVAFLPGTCFGRSPSEYSVRMSYVDFDGEAALETLKTLRPEDAIDETLLRQLCGPTVTAIQRVAEWCRSL